MPLTDADRCPAVPQRIRPESGLAVHVCQDATGRSPVQPQLVYTVVKNLLLVHRRRGGRNHLNRNTWVLFHLDIWHICREAHAPYDVLSLVKRRHKDEITAGGGPIVSLCTLPACLQCHRFALADKVDIHCGRELGLKHLQRWLVPLIIGHAFHKSRPAIAGDHFFRRLLLSAFFGRNSVPGLDICILILKQASVRLGAVILNSGQRGFRGRGILHCNLILRIYAHERRSGCGERKRQKHRAGQCQDLLLNSYCIQGIFLLWMSHYSTGRKDLHFHLQISSPGVWRESDGLRDGLHLPCHPCSAAISLIIRINQKLKAKGFPGSC